MTIRWFQLELALPDRAKPVARPGLRASTPSSNPALEGDPGPMADGFIRAEVTPYEVFMENGSEQAVRKQVYFRSKAKTKSFPTGT